MTLKSKAEIKAEQQAQQAKQGNTATLDRPVCDEIKQIFVTSMTSTYEACVDARNRGINAGIERFRRENSTGNDDFFADWEVEATQIIESRFLSLNALPSSQAAIDLDNLDQYDIKILDARLDELQAKGELTEDECHEFDVIDSYLVERKNTSNPCPDLSSGN